MQYRILRRGFVTGKDLNRSLGHVFMNFKVDKREEFFLRFDTQRIMNKVEPYKRIRLASGRQWTFAYHRTNQIPIVSLEPPITGLNNSLGWIALT